MEGRGGGGGGESAVFMTCRVWAAEKGERGEGERESEYLE